MSKTLFVDEKKLGVFLQSGASNAFLIPDYQRKYEWGKDEIDVLFDDLSEFTRTVKIKNSDDTYFLGTIVSHVLDNGEGDREIIDGQQRIVSILLLLRAIYTKLSQAPMTVRIQNLTRRIATVIWKVIDPMEGTVDCTKNFIRSESIDDNYKDVLQSILTTGKVPTGKNCDYASNYRRLQKKYADLYMKDQSMAEWMAYYLLDQVIVFSIEAKTRDAAITIFSTINNRGKSLTDTDIIRAKIYGFLDDDEKKSFNAEWHKLITRISEIKETSENVLSYYMYYVRALDNDVDSTMKGLKKYFTLNKSEKLKDKNILPTLDLLLNIWAVAKTHEPLDGEPWSLNADIIKIFDLLLPFQNYAWRSAASVYYLVHRNEKDFEKNFLAFLRKFFSWYVPLYILNPDRTLIREYVLKLDVAIKKSAHPSFNLPHERDRDRLKKKIISEGNSILRRMLLKAAAYNHPDQTDLLPDACALEYVFDKNSEQLGNMTLIETKLKKEAMNLPFARKKEIYLKSEIAMTQSLIDEPDDWTPDAIAVRSNKLAESLIALWQRWSDDYEH